MSMRNSRPLLVGLILVAFAAAAVSNTHAAAAATSAAITPQQPASFADIVEQAEPAVVTITVTKSASARQTMGMQGGHGQLQPSPFDDFFERFFGGQMPPGAQQRPMRALGSGFFVDEDGYIVTNNHVIDGADEMTVVLSDGRELDATLVGRDPKTDLALIKVNGDERFPALQFGDSDSARVGDWVLAIGNPFGLGGTATAGIISARGRDIRSGPYDDFLQIDAPINSGNSGGPIVNAQGKVIGVNTAIYSPNGGNVGIGFAIPATQARHIVDELKVDHVVHRGWLGVQIQDLDADLAQSLGLELPDGALVAEVISGSPADKAGIAVGDVVTSFGDHDIDSAKSLGQAVAEEKPGSTARVRVWRDHDYKTVKVKVAEMEEPDDVLAMADGQTTTGQLGLSLAPLTDRDKAGLGLPDDVAGVVVESVQPGSEADRKGMRPGDVITQVNGHAVKRPESVRDEIDDSDRDRVLLLVRRGDNQYFAALALS